MVSNPKAGDVVQLHYAADKRRVAPYHGLIGRVVIPSRSRRTRNHGVEIDGRIVVVPAGQLRLSVNRVWMFDEGSIT